MKIKFLAATAFLMAFTIANTNAQTVRNGKTQHQRIKQGVKSGELTRAEAVNLRNGQKEIRQEVTTAKADGLVTRDERKEIRQDRKQESRKIALKKHNTRVRN
jgi:methylthioribose-1-phosphate isomerase